MHMNATSGVITTPNYPGDYPNFIDFCLWTIQLHPSVLITLECNEFSLEYKEGCIFDYMELLAGVSSDSPVLGRYCGVHNESLVFERQGNISIKFGSDKDKEFKGFHCTYNVYKGQPKLFLLLSFQFHFGKPKNISFESNPHHCTSRNSFVQLPSQQTMSRSTAQ